MTSFTPWEASTSSEMGSNRRHALDIATLVVVVADGSESRCRQIAQALQDLGVRDVTQVHSLVPAIERLKRQPVDILVSGEHLLDHHGSALLDAVRRVSPATRTLLLPDDGGPDASDPMLANDPTLSATRVLLKTVVHAAVAAQGAFWCKVPDLSLSDILQMYHQLRRQVTVLVSGRVAGRIRLERGELVHAESEDQLGIAALCRLLDADSGLIRTDTSAFEAVHTLSGPFHRVLLDAMELLDARREVQRAGNAVDSNPSHLNQGHSSQADADANERILSEPPRQPPIELPHAAGLATGKGWPRLRPAALIVAGGLIAAGALYVLVTHLSNDSADRTTPVVVRNAAEPAPVPSAPEPSLPVESVRSVDAEQPSRLAPTPAPTPSPPPPGAPASGAVQPRSPAARAPAAPPLDIRLQR
jgi:CheY-like chemotaxis protein